MHLHKKTQSTCKIPQTVQGRTCICCTVDRNCSRFSAGHPSLPNVSCVTARIVPKSRPAQKFLPFPTISSTRTCSSLARACTAAGSSDTMLRDIALLNFGRFN